MASHRFEVLSLKSTLDPNVPSSRPSECLPLVLVVSELAEGTQAEATGVEGEGSAYVTADVQDDLATSFFVVDIYHSLL